MKTNVLQNILFSSIIGSLLFYYSHTYYNFIEPYSEILILLILSGISIVFVLYKKLTRMGYAKIDQQGVWRSGRLIPWKRINRIEWSDEEMWLSLYDGGSEHVHTVLTPQSLCLAENSGFNDIEVKIDSWLILSRFPNPESFRTFINGSTGIRNIYKGLVRGGISVTILFLLWIAILIFLLGGATLWLAVLAMPLCTIPIDSLKNGIRFWAIERSGLGSCGGLSIRLEENGLVYQTAGKGIYVPRSDFESIFVFNQLGVLNTIVITVKNNGKLYIPFLTSKSTNKILAFARLTRKGGFLLFSQYG